jgi:putative chitinase
MPTTPTKTIITPELLKKMLPTIGSEDIETYLPILNELLPKYKIDTPKRLAAYFAQIGHESLDLGIKKENLYYSTPERLRQVYGSVRFPTVELAKQYTKQPEKLANYVYGGRLGNSEPNDGWLYRGKGSIQVTGKSNYREYSLDTYGDTRCVKNPDLLCEPLDYIQSSLWYWSKRDANYYADKDDIRGLTKIINGGYNGLIDREKRYKNCCKALGI